MYVRHDFTKLTYFDLTVVPERGRVWDGQGRKMYEVGTKSSRTFYGKSPSRNASDPRRLPREK